MLSSKLHRRALLPFFHHHHQSPVLFSTTTPLLFQQFYSFRDNNNNNPRQSKYKARKEQLDNIFKSKQKHASENRRIRSIETPIDVDAAATHQLQRQRSSSSVTRPAVSLLELEQEQDPSLFSSSISDEADNSNLVNDALSVPTGHDALLAAVEDESTSPTTSILIDDTFGYLPALKQELDAVPGQALVPPGLTRMRLDIQFRGEHFFGWDRQALMIQNLQQEAKKQQKHDTGRDSGSEIDEQTTQASLSSAALARSVRNALEEALVVALDLDELPNKNVQEGGGIVPSCILETGVHARRLTCHVDVPSDLVMQPRTVLQRAHIWLNKCNDPLGILSFTPAPPGFHARHSTRRRVFVYKCLNRIAPPLFDVGTQWHVDRTLDIERMNEACKMLQGEQDYTAFADPKIMHSLRRFKGSGVKNIERIHVTRQEDEVFIWFVGKSFLRHQIRNMVSVLKMVGQGLWDEEILEQFLKGPTKNVDMRTVIPTGKNALGKAVTNTLEVQGVAKWKSLQPPTAPTHGLWLWNSEYNDIPNTEKFDSVDSGSG